MKQIRGQYTDHDGTRYVRIKPVINIKVPLDQIIRNPSQADAHLKTNIAQFIARVLPTNDSEDYDLQLDRVPPEAFGLVTSTEKENGNAMAT